MSRVMALSMVFVIAVLLAIVTKMELAGPVRVTVHSSDSYMQRARIVHSVDSSDKWVADVGKIFLYENGTMARLKDIVLTVPDKKISVKAPYAYYDVKAGEIDVKGEITASNGDYEIRSKDIVWNSKSETLYGGKGVYLRGRDMTLSADTMVSHKGEEVNLNGNVKVIFN
ncbi:MAG: hypothetical protein HQK89_14475 [Nitrospirae bacterium]|nr:hypothetical protein [Nitrospirota bacterium]